VVRGAGAGWRSPALVKSCRMTRSLHRVMRAISRGPCPWLVRSLNGEVPFRVLAAVRAADRRHRGRSHPSQRPSSPTRQA
jgi:membrane-associated PAP2 superfamily phosphatase